jgi:hypothetical protein
MKNEIRVKEERNMLYKIKRRKANWIGHVLRRNCLLKHVIEGNILVDGKEEGTGRRERRRKHLLDDLKETRRYCNLKEEALSGEFALEEAMDVSQDRLRNEFSGITLDQ